jgi:DNA mismatch repair ATPase MutS
MVVITGSNGSGKVCFYDVDMNCCHLVCVQTVYIKQVALIVILAQIGCFVPAKHATIPVRDRILCRLGTSDDLEHNMSTFQTEMKECVYILNMITSNSLVIVDELGRGTSNIDGTYT